jgi:hypothetical protein
MRDRAKAYIAGVVALGAMALIAGFSRWESRDLLRFLSFLFLALLAGTLKVRLPAITGTFSLTFVFVLLGVADFSLSETLAAGGAATLVQCLWNARQKPRLVQVLFNVAAVATSISFTYTLAHSVSGLMWQENLPLMLAFAASFYFAANTVLVAGVLALAGDKPFKAVWSQWFLWSFPYYLVGAAMAGFMSVSSRHVGWHACLLALPLMYLVYYYYRLSVEKLSGES